MQTLKIGVIGTGNMGMNHVRNLSENKRFELVGIYDNNDERAQYVALKYGVKKFDDIDNLLAQIDAVVIAVPSTLHTNIAIQVAQHDVHALIEKPLATNSIDAIKIVDAFNARNLKLAVGHIERFNPAFRELKRLVSDETIYYIESRRYSPFSGSGRITDTTVVEDLMIHDVDLVCSLMEEKKLTSVHGRGETVSSGQIDFATCLMDFEGKTHAIVNASRVSQDKERSITIHTADSCYYADLLTKSLKITKSTNISIDLKDNSSYRQDGVVQKVYIPIEEPLRAELVAFYEAIVNDVPIEADGDVGIRAIKICEEVASRAKQEG